MPRKKEDDDFLWWIIIFFILFGSSTSDAQLQTPRSPDTSQVKARAIIARHNSVSGRPDGRSPLQYSHRISEMETPAIKTVIEQWSIAPNRTLTRMTMVGAGATEIGYNGTVGWTISPLTGPVLIEGEPLKELAKLAAGRTQLDKPFKTLSAGAPTVVEGKDVVPVAFEDDQGNAGTLFFDAKTGLLHAMSQRITDTPQAEYTMWTFISDYKRFDGELVALTTTMKAQGQNIVTRTTHVDHKVIDTTMFVPPPAVAALIRKAP